MTELSVNLNAVAFLRNRRDVPWPDLCHIARVVLDAGAVGLTVHPRPDERHIRRTDVYDLAEVLSDYPGKEFNIEGYPTEDFLALVHDVKPDQVTLVPDDPAQATSDHGWDFDADGAMLAPLIAGLKSAGMRVAVFVDALPTSPAGARLVGADRIEIYTGPYGGASGESVDRELQAIAATAQAASNQEKGSLLINAGHDLTAANLPALVRAVPDLAEVSIGHGLTADALLVGFAEAVRIYREALAG